MEEVLSSGSEEVVKFNVCTVCKEQRRYLKEMPCKHLFCEYCLQCMINQCSYNTIFCPLCRTPAPVSDLGASAYPIHFADTARTEMAQAALGRLTLQRTVCRECSAGDVRRMLFTCAECRVTVCTCCNDQHLESGHTLVLLQAGDGEDAFRRYRMQQALDRSECSDHEGNRLTHYCLKCSVLVCSLCMGLHHHGHETEELEQAAAAGREKLEAVKQCLRPLKSKLQWFGRDVRKAIEDADADFNIASALVTTRVKEIQSILDKTTQAANAELAKLKDKLKERYVKDLHAVETKLTAVMAKENHVQRVLDSHCSYSAVRMKTAAELNTSKRHLKRFSERLPTDVFRVVFSSEGRVTAATKAIEKFVGSARVEIDQRSDTPPTSKIEADD